MGERPKYERLEIIEAEGKPPLVPSVPSPVDTPAKIVEEALRIVQVRMDNVHEGRRDIDNPTLFHENVAVTVEAFGVVVLMETLRRVAPEVADRAADVLWKCWDAGDVIGEHVWVWRQEIANGGQIDGGGYVIGRIVDPPLVSVGEDANGE